MARRRSDDGLLIEVIAAFADLPLWVAPIGAVFIYVAFAYAPEWFASTQTHPDAVVMFVRDVLRKLAPYVSAMVLLSGLVGAAKRLMSQRADRTLVNGNRTLEQIRALPWSDFERYCADAFRRQGYEAELTPPGPDGGVDLRLRRDGQLVYVQCKSWRNTLVPVERIREFYGVMAAAHVPRGIFVASGRFTADAQAFASQVGIELIDGAALEKLVGDLCTKDA